MNAGRLLAAAALPPLWAAITSQPTSAEIVFPGSDWMAVPPQSVGLDPVKLQELQEAVGGSGIIVRSGYLAWSWGDLVVARNWASASKPVVSTMLFAAVNEGLCTFQSTMGEYHAGGSTKDRSITFHQLANQTSGYSRGENPDDAWAYNDHAMNLYGYTLFHSVYNDTPQNVCLERLAPLGFEDSVTISDFQYGRIVAMSIRDFARIGLLWLARGTWDGIEIVPSSYFDLVMNQVSAALPQSTLDGPESWNFGTFGGGDNQEVIGPGEYGYNFWVNTNGFWPGVPANAYQASGHAGQQVCTVLPSLEIVAVGIGTWRHPSTEALNILVEAAETASSAGHDLEHSSWGGIKAGYSSR
jgi:CubicO group peptidase (beta-lactamase class C family)